MTDRESWFSRINNLGDWDYRIFDLYYCYLYPELRLTESVHDRARVHRGAKLHYAKGLWRSLLLIAPIIAILTYVAIFVVPDVARGAGFVVLPAAVVAVVLNLAVFGAYMFGINKAFVFPRMRAAIRAELNSRGIPVCVKCGYDLRGQLEPRCPECGEPEKKS